MFIKINETGELLQLRAIDANGIEWTRDLIEDGGRMHDDDGNTIMTQEDYDWWHQYISDMDADEAELKAFTDELRGLGVDNAVDEVRDTVADYLSCTDMEDHHRNRQNAIAELRERHGLTAANAEHAG
jgi:hypothetical protein